MSTSLATRDNATGAIAERVVILGDLSQLNGEQRSKYYIQVCQSLDLNPLTRPFSYLKLNGREILYANRDCTDQLRKRDNVSVTIVGRERTEDLIVVTARATMPDGRTDESIGALPLGRLQGEALANALMKCETKAKRRVTLSICGLGFMDESEVDGALADEASRGGILSPHAAPDEDVNAPAKQSDEWISLMATLAKADLELFDPACTWETMTRWRAELGSKGKPTGFGKRLSTLWQSEDISPGQRKEMGALSNRVDRKLTALEAKLKAPPVEASFTDDPETDAFAPERQPGEDDDL